MKKYKSKILSMMLISTTMLLLTKTMVTNVYALYTRDVVESVNVLPYEDLHNVVTLPKTNDKEKLDSIVNKVVEESVEEKLETIEPEISVTIEERIKEACEYYGIRYDIVLAIARLETGWFTSEAYIYGNNPGGLSKNEKPISFDSIDEGVEAFVFNLANNYFAIGLDTPEKIGSKYCPIDPNWAIMVEELMSYKY